ncbi:PDZ domain-containing protein [Streptomyces pseudovenezuelae]|uniref:S1-C subfamily serine protease n=1 Tax=Streptomyces pseudovenezuelae TaxID=67350 RepID=A0ABT6LBE6_9ACTN|nr:PDZ domain-containing protein [Streptomyces pseudovenezuelae]MDH6213635.1 S1-C subfamily serine protease [Streptomyces pseudovenezuelae]
MAQTALRPKPMPGQEPGGGAPTDPARRPHAARRRGRRLRALLFGLFVGTVLVLSGVGLGTVGATVIGMSKLADMQRQAAGQAPRSQAGALPKPPASTATPGSSVTPDSSSTPSSATPAATLGVEAVDAEKTGALVVGVHVPGPGYTAGLVRGDVLLNLDKTRIDSAADLARAVAHARPGQEVTLTVRHQSGGYQQLTAVPGIVT